MRGTDTPMFKFCLYPQQVRVATDNNFTLYDSNWIRNVSGELHIQFMISTIKHWLESGAVPLVNTW